MVAMNHPERWRLVAALEAPRRSLHRKHWHEKCTGPAVPAAAPGRPGRPGRRQSDPGAGRRPPRVHARPASPRRRRIRGCAIGLSQCRIRPSFAFSFSRVVFSAACSSWCRSFLLCRSCSPVVAPRRAFSSPFSSAGSPSSVKPVSRSGFGSAIAFPLEVVRNFQARKPRARAHIGFV